VVGGVILHKLKHPPPPLNKVNPLISYTYSKAKKGKHMQQDLNISHLKPQVHNHVYSLIKKYWPVFDANGVFVHVKNYECVIDTGYSLNDHQENSLWTKGDSHHEEGHCFPRKGWQDTLIIDGC
jgi:hypothetical protein